MIQGDHGVRWTHALVVVLLAVGVIVMLGGVAWTISGMTNRCPPSTTSFECGPADLFVHAGLTGVAVGAVIFAIGWSGHGASPPPRADATQAQDTSMRRAP